jgi:hypothetical protein
MRYFSLSEEYNSTSSIGCKIPQAELLKLLEGIGNGIGMDCSVVPLRQKGLFMITTTDYFFPLVDDPYVQVVIICSCEIINNRYRGKLLVPMFSQTCIAWE